MKLGNLKIKVKIIGIASILIIVIFSFLGTYIYQTQKKEIKNEANERMLSHLEDLYLILKNHVESKQHSVNISLNLAHNILYNSGDIEESPEKIQVIGVNQLTNEENIYEINRLILNGESLYGNFKLVDLIKEKSVETATIFQKIDDGYLRISTNVMKNNGERAVGTFIPNDSEVIKTIEQGKTFFGRAFVVDDWYLTAYEPIYINKQIKGVLYVGVKEMDHAFLKKIFSDKTYYTSGYPFLVTKDGDFTIHPNKENENFAEATFFKQLINAKPGQYKSSYVWPENNKGKKKQQYFKYFEPYQSYLCVSLYEDEIYASANNLLIILFVSMIISIGLFLIGLILFLNPIIKGIKEIERVSNKIYHGNLNSTIKIKNKDELGQTADSLQKTIDNLNHIVTNFHNGAEEISTIASQLSKSSQEVSQGASEQASATEEISSTVEQMNANIHSTTDNAINTEKNAVSAAQGIQECSDATNQAVSAMKNIADKIKIIDDIAFQTNILALNAAVEAARAGDHGKGFAVVASEVRNLAERSKAAAEDIVELSKSGVEISIKAGKQLEEIVPEIKKNASLLREISAGSTEQKSGVSQIDSSIQQINVSTQQNAVAAEEMASSAEELSRQVIQLKKSIEFFTTSTSKPEKDKKAPLSSSKSKEIEHIETPELSEISF